MHAQPRSTTSLLVRLLKNTFGNYLLIVLVVTMAVGSVASPFFLTARNIENVVTFSAVFSVLAIGQFFVVVTGGIDLSVGSVACLTTVVAAVMMGAGYTALGAGIAAIGVAILCGVINGVVIVKGGITPFIATLAMLSIARGVAYLVQAGSLIQISDATFLESVAGRTGPLPNPVIFFILIMFAAAFTMRATTFGRRLYAIGGNPEAARLSGLPVTRTVLLAYAASSLLAGVAGLILAGQLRLGSSLLARGYELDSIAAVVVGGASLMGGTGSPIGAVIGGLIIGAIGNIMNLVGIPSEPQLVVKGLLIIVAVFFIGGEGAGRIRRLIVGFLPGRGQPAALGSRDSAAPAAEGTPDASL